MHDNDTCGLRVLYEIRELVEPVPGKLMQDELVEAIRRIIAERDAARAACAAAVKVWEAGCVDRGWKDERNWIDDVRDQLDEVIEKGTANAD
jgi:hypothetical protein